MKIAYSAYLESYIRKKLFITNSHWFFTKCDENGVRTSSVMKAGSRFDCFNWKEIKKVIKN